MRKISTITLGLILAATTFDSNAIKVKDGLTSEQKTQAEATITKGRAAALDAHTAKILEAVGTGNGVLIAPQLYVMPHNISAPRNKIIQFHDAEGNLIEEAKIANRFFESAEAQIEFIKCKQVFSPAANFMIYALEKPVKNVTPVPVDKRKKFHHDQDESHKFIGYFTEDSGAKVAVEFKSYEIVRGIESTAFIQQDWDAYRLNMVDVEHGHLELEGKDAGAPLIHINDHGNATLMGIWSSSPSLPELQAQAFNFTVIANSQETVDKAVAEFGNIQLHLGEDATRAKMLYIRGPKKHTAYARQHVQDGKFHASPMPINALAFGNGEHNFTVCERGKERYELVLVNRSFSAGAVKIDNVDNTVRITKKLQHLDVTVTDSKGAKIECVSQDDTHLLFDNVEPGMITILFHFDDRTDIKVTYAHNVKAS